MTAVSVRALLDRLRTTPDHQQTTENEKGPVPERGPSHYGLPLPTYASSTTLSSGIGASLSNTHPWLEASSLKIFHTTHGSDLLCVAHEEHYRSKHDTNK